MTEMVERVARAICAVTNIAMEGVTEVVLDNPDFVIPANRRTDGKPLERWRLYVPQARAAIEAMREIPEEPGPRYTAGEYSRRNMQAAIDDALGRSLHWTVQPMILPEQPSTYVKIK